MPPEYVMQWLPIGWIGAAVAAVAALAWLWRTILGPTLHRLNAASNRVSQVLDDWQGTPARPGVPARPGIMEQMYGFKAALEAGEKITAEHTDAINDIRHHVKPNHGTSAWDEMGRKVDAVAKQVDGVANAQVFVVVTVEGMAENVGGLRGEVQQLRADHAGRITRLEEHEDKEDT